jgi:hypothetical protein
MSVSSASDGTTDRTVEIRVTNEGDVDGRYVGAVNRTGPRIAYTPVEYVNRVVEAGETVTVEASDSWSTYSPGESRDENELDVTYYLEDAYGGDSLDVAVEE